MRGLPLLAACVAAGAGIATAGTPRPGIVLGRRIGAVSFGERKSHVDAALGRSEEKRLDRYRGRWLFYPRAGLYVGYFGQGGKKYAFAVATHSPRYRTSTGVGVGSTVRQLRSRVQVTCYYRGGSATVPSECQHEGASISLPFTAFAIDPATTRVTEVDIFPGGD